LNGEVHMSFGFRRFHYWYTGNTWWSQGDSDHS